MDKRQNIFADISEGVFEEDHFKGLLIISIFCFFLWAWIHYESFVFALIIAVLVSPWLCGPALFFIVCVIGLFAHQEGDTFGSHLLAFVIALAPLSLFGAWSYFMIWLLP